MSAQFLLGYKFLSRNASITNVASTEIASFAGKGVTYENLSGLNNAISDIAKTSKAGIDDISIYAQGKMDKFIILGRNQADRVNVFAKELAEKGLNVKTINSDLPLGPANPLENGTWMQQQLNNGYSIIDIGLDPAYTSGKATGKPSFNVTLRRSTSFRVFWSGLA